MYRTDKQFMKNPATNASRIYIGNLPKTIVADDLEEKFKVHGPVLGILLHVGFGFLQYETEQEAYQAIMKENNSFLKGQNITVRPATKKGGPQPMQNVPPQQQQMQQQQNKPPQQQQQQMQQQQQQNKPFQQQQQFNRPPQQQQQMQQQQQQNKPFQQQPQQQNVQQNQQQIPQNQQQQNMPPKPNNNQPQQNQNQQAPKPVTPAPPVPTPPAPVKLEPMEQPPNNHQQQQNKPNNAQQQHQQMDNEPNHPGPNNSNNNKNFNARNNNNANNNKRNNQMRQRSHDGSQNWNENQGQKFDNRQQQGGRGGGRGRGNFQNFNKKQPHFGGGGSISDRVTPIDDYNASSQYSMERMPDEKNDCEIIVVSKALTEYAEFIEDRLKQLGLIVDLLFPNEDVPIGKVLANISSRGCIYAILVMPQNEEHRSLTLNILHGVPQEHRNMPLEDALVLISRNFEAYMRGETLPAEKPGEMNLVDKHPVPMQMALNMLAENRQLTSSQYDKLIKYLQDRRDLQYQFEVAEGVDQESQESTSKQAELQNRILNILNKSQTEAPIPMSITAEPAVEAAPPTPLLKDPSVQKALDSFLGDMLKNISS